MKGSLNNSTIKQHYVGWFSEKIKKADIFYQDIEILFDNDKPKLQTHCGVVMGIIMISIILSYTYMKASIMLAYQDNQIQEPVRENFFGADYEMTAKDGWRIAFGVTGYGSESNIHLFDDTIGKLEAYVDAWGETDANGNSVVENYKPKETEPCKRSDVNFDGDENQDGYRFWKPS